MNHSDKEIMELKLLCESVIDPCVAKRSYLMARSQSLSEKYKVLTFSAGVLALISGILATALVANFLSNLIVGVLTATLGFISGIISLYTGVFVDRSEIESTISGASKFLEVRNRAKLLLVRSKADERGFVDEVRELLSAYQTVSEVYDKYIPDYVSSKIMGGYSHSELKAESMMFLGADEEGGWRPAENG